MEDQFKEKIENMSSQGMNFNNNGQMVRLISMSQQNITPDTVMMRCIYACVY